MTGLLTVSSRSRASRRSLCILLVLGSFVEEIHDLIFETVVLCFSSFPNTQQCARWLLFQQLVQVCPSKMLQDAPVADRRDFERFIT